MTLKHLLIANRGEIAIRIARTAAEMGVRTVAIHSEDDAQSLHIRSADDARALEGQGPSAYLDADQLIEVANATGCDAVHPGYGFLSENEHFAKRCEEAGLTFVGPRPEVLGLFGDKSAARTFAVNNGVNVVSGTDGPTTLAEARDFLTHLGPDGAIMVKAIAGGGGRGMRMVTDAEQLSRVFERCQSEAENAFGNGDLYVEQLFSHARHIEVQVLGDGVGGAVHLWERECSIQRERQKIIEIAPAPFLASDVRAELLNAALTLARKASYRGAGTFEFLVDASPNGDGHFAFIEANARLQVEHTVTEEVLGIDLVAAQLAIAGGSSLEALGLDQTTIGSPRGMALQARVNLESMQTDGGVRAAGGVLSAYEPPSGPGVRVDGYGYAGYRTNPRFDSLLAKVIVHTRTEDFAQLAGKTVRALAEFRLGGVASNLGFLQAILAHPAMLGGSIHTNFVTEHLESLLEASPTPAKWFEEGEKNPPRRPGANIDSRDPLAIVALGKSFAPSAVDEADTDVAEAPEGTVALRAPMQGTIVSVTASEGSTVRPGEEVMVMEAMKMQHSITADVACMVRALAVNEGETVFEGEPLAFLEERPELGEAAVAREEVDLDYIRTDLAEVLERQRLTLDEARPNAVAKRRRTGQRTTRENIAHLVDDDSFVEYGALTLAARRRTNTVEELVEQSPADGIVLGLATINGESFSEDIARAAIAAYDYTVMAGTQGRNGHRKQDRFFELCADLAIPLVLLAEGGGGRGSDSDTVGGSETDTFYRFAALSGGAPLIGIASGRCFAGNAVLLGCCDVIIATRDANIGMAGPAMIEGGGLGVYRPEDIGPMSVQVPSGVVDIAVEDEAEAVDVAKQYLSYFQGPLPEWSSPDQRRLRHIVPENRLRGYDMRELIRTIADDDSMLEVRKGWGLGMITALIRIEGRPMGVIANNPMHLGGAVDSDAADKAARFMQMCDAHELPILSLNDNPGNMVGPEAEKTALVRHCCRSYLIGANITVPLFFVIIRKAIGLGKLAMTGGGMKKGIFAISWPTGEFAGMGIEGQVKLGRQKELAAIEDPEERIAAYERWVAELYEIGKALNTGSHFQVDDVIDPADTRRWIRRGLHSLGPKPAREGKKRPWVDGW